MPYLIIQRSTQALKIVSLEHRSYSRKYLDMVRLSRMGACLDTFVFRGHSSGLNAIVDYNSHLSHFYAPSSSYFPEHSNHDYFALVVVLLVSQAYEVMEQELINNSCLNWPRKEAVRGKASSWGPPLFQPSPQNTPRHLFGIR